MFVVAIQQIMLVYMYVWTHTHTHEPKKKKLISSIWWSAVIYLVHQSSTNRKRLCFVFDSLDVTGLYGPRIWCLIPMDQTEGYVEDVDPFVLGGVAFYHIAIGKLGMVVAGTTFQLKYMVPSSSMRSGILPPRNITKKWRLVVESQKFIRNLV